MGALKIIFPVVIAVILVGTVNSSVMAEQNSNQAAVESSKEQLLATNSCPRCDLSGVDLDRANLTGANLEGAILSKAKFRLATLTKANLRNTDLRDAELGGADLAEADLRGADLRGATLAGAYLVGAQFDNDMSARPSSEAIVVENDSAGNVANNDLAAASQGPGFLDNTLQGMKGLFGLGDAETVQEVTTTTDKIENSEKVVPIIAPVQPPLPDASAADNVAAIEETPVVTKEAEPIVAEESGYFDNTVARVKDWFGQGDSSDHETIADNTKNVIQEDKQAHEKEATDSMGSKTVSTEQTETEKNRALLLKTKRCYNCNLVSVDLSGKNLAGADLEGADLTGSNLQGADLEKANLKGASLLRVDFRDADLRGADLYKANLSGADLTGAKLDGALLDDTQISDAVGFTSDN